MYQKLREKERGQIGRQTEGGRERHRERGGKRESECVCVCV